MRGIQMNNDIDNITFDWEDKFINNLLVGLTIVFGIGLAASLLRIIDSSMQTSHIVQVFLYIILVIFTLYRKKISTDGKVKFLITLFAAVAYTGIYSWGVYAAGYISAVGAMALITLFYGYKKALWFIGFTVGFIIFCAYQYITGKIQFPVDANNYLMMPSSWGVLIFAGVLIMALLMVILSRMKNQMEQIQNSLIEEKERVTKQDFQLRETNNKLNLAMNIARQGWFDSDLKSGNVVVSDGYTKMLGYEKNEYNEDINSWHEHVHPDEREKARNNFQKSMLTGEKFEVEFRRRTKDGKWLWLHSIGNVVEWDKENKPLRLVGILTDITERKRVEKSIQRAKESAEKANQAKTDFLSSMSHELRTPLNAILGFAQLLETDPDIPLIGYQEESVQYIRTGGKHLLNLINQMLELTAIESGKVELFMEDIHLGDIVNQSVAMVSPIAKKTNIKIIILTDLFVSIRADEVRLKQILLNLLNNAIKYNHEGGSLNINWQITENGAGRVSINDTGIGISTIDQPKIFNTFSRLGQEKSNIEGTGLGLVVTKNIVELMGGTVGFTSEEGKGSTFWFDLPLAEKSVGYL